MFGSYLLFKLFFFINSLLTFGNIWFLTLCYLRWDINSWLSTWSSNSSFDKRFWRLSLSFLHGLLGLLSSIHGVLGSFKITWIGWKFFENNYFRDIIFNFFGGVVAGWSSSSNVCCFSRLLLFDCAWWYRIRTAHLCIWSNLLSHLFLNGAINIFYFLVSLRRTWIIDVRFLRCFIFFRILYCFFSIVSHRLLNLVIKYSLR